MVLGWMAAFAVIANPARIEVVDGSLEALFRDLVAAIAIISALFVLLIAASVTRRLHDTGWRGIWALVPVVLLLAGFAFMAMVLMPNMLSTHGSQAAMDLQVRSLMAAMAINAIYLFTLGLLIAQLCRSGTPGPNRFGG